MNPCQGLNLLIYHDVIPDFPVTHKLLLGTILCVVAVNLSEFHRNFTETLKNLPIFKILFPNCQYYS